MESFQTILKAIHYREQLKRYTIESKVGLFEHERSLKLFVKAEYSQNDSKIVEISKDLRNSYKVSEVAQFSIPVIQPQPSTQLRLSTELPCKRLRPEVQKKTDISFDVALICCKLITEGEKLKLWPLIDPRRGEISENSHLPIHTMQPKKEDKLKMRGRINRSSKRVAIDRLIMNDCEHSWGRYMGLSGNWHNLETEMHSEFYDDEDNDAFQRLHKLLIHGYRNFSKFRNH